MVLSPTWKSRCGFWARPANKMPPGTGQGARAPRASKRSDGALDNDASDQSHPFSVAQGFGNLQTPARNR